MNKITDSLIELVNSIETNKFEIEKADFNDEPTSSLRSQLEQKMDQLVKEVTNILESTTTIQLPPLQVHNPKPDVVEVDEDVSNVIEKIGIEDKEDSTDLVQLSGENPEHHKLLVLLGVWYTNQRQADLATGYFKEVLDGVSSEYEDIARYNLSYCLAVQKVLTPAFDYLEGISNSFDQNLVLLNKAVIFDKLGRFDEANKAFEKIDDNSDYHKLALFNWGLSAIEFGKLDKARTLLKELLIKAPDFPGLHFHLGQIAARQGLYTDAVSAFQVAYRDNPDNLEILADLANACLLGNRVHDAIDYYQQYLKKDASLSVLNNLGAALLKTHQYQQAVNIFNQALEIKPDHKQSLKNLDLAKSYLN